MKYVLVFIVLIVNFNYVKAQVFGETQKIVASDREELGRFGHSVDISGNFAVVGSYGLGAFNNGQAYVFEKQGANWVQTQILQNSDNENYDRFGYAVAIGGDYIVIGAYGEDDDVNGNNNLSRAGSAYIFKNNGGTWTQVQKIIASDRTDHDEFGWSVDIDGNTIIVGAHLEDEDESGLNFIYHAGSAYVFELNVGTGVWTETQKIVASSRTADLTFPNGGNSGEDVSDLFGHSVAISGNYLVVGSLNHDWDETNTISTLNGGAVYVFEKNGGVWTEVQKIVNSDVHVSDRFGYSVAIDSNQIAVGTYSQDYSITGTNYMPNSGAVYVIKRNLAGVWSQQQKLVAAVRNTGDRFGWSVSIDSMFLVVGAKEDNGDKNETNALNDAGSAYVFKLNSGSQNYDQHQKIDASDRQLDDFFGGAVAINNTTIMVGAFQQDWNPLQADSISNAGAVYVFETINCPTVNTSQNVNICNGETLTVGNNTYTTSGTYTDTLLTTLGCDSIITTNLSVVAGFEITQNVNICYGESYSIGNSVYTTPGNYADTLQMTTGTCDSIVYTNLNIVPPINTSLDVNDNTIQSNQNNAYYQWVDCNNNYQPFLINTANQQEITINQTGNYAVIINVSGCIDTSACVYVNFVGLTDNYDVLNNVKVYPNPAQNYLNIQLNQTTPFAIQIIDISGKILYQSNLTSEQTTVNISNYKKGLYFIKITTNKQTLIKQFVKQ